MYVMYVYKYTDHTRQRELRVDHTDLDEHEHIYMQYLSRRDLQHFARTWISLICPVCVGYLLLGDGGFAVTRRDSSFTIANRLQRRKDHTQT